MREVHEALPKGDEALTFELLKSLPLLRRAIEETLRLNPPVSTLAWLVLAWFFPRQALLSRASLSSASLPRASRSSLARSRLNPMVIVLTCSQGDFSASPPPFSPLSTLVFHATAAERKETS